MSSAVKLGPGANFKALLIGHKQIFVLTIVAEKFAFKRISQISKQNWVVSLPLTLCLHVTLFIFIQKAQDG